MNDTRNVTQDRQQDVDEEVCATAALKEDTDRGEDDGKKDLADIAVKCQSHYSGWRTKI